MSHWHSGLPKLELEPFDPTPLYDAVRSTVAETAVAQERRRTSLRTAGIVGAVVTACAVVGGLVALLA
ncbi:hypothetical protein G7075_08710 [Phycicoccus sp. HDW14]|uniref:hypothetical protein n=1 Tax=Phycicoccus sp. HDW14 TaxID=2714941 RepID=UPI00140B6E01|nr:hypothetical protein [Phycicoccus sp. HDW14]QIM21192.1 hypothetical protein G7075_08710 [Phycicoccus sp. HDW14]